MTKEKTILGLDIGVGSIGWALVRVREDDDTEEALHITSSVRIIRYKEEGYKGEAAAFTKGNGVTINKDRTAKRTVRKGLERYKQRKRLLMQTLETHGLYTESTTQLPEWTPLARWERRAAAASEQIPLQDLGRVLLHVNTKRGFRGSRKDAADSEATKYKAAIKLRTEALQGRTIGQFLYDEMLATQQYDKNGRLHDNAHFDTKNRIYNRAEYESEMLRICAKQAEFYPEILTPECIEALRQIIYYQRPLRSQKHLVSFCRYESYEIEIKDNNVTKKVRRGAKTAPISNPLAGMFRVWQTMLNLKVTEGRKQVFPTDDSIENAEKYKDLFDAFRSKESLTAPQILEALGYKGHTINLKKTQTVKGFDTHFKIKKAFEKAGITNATVLENYLYFDPTGVLDEQPLFRLWHILYSIESSNAVVKALQKQFGLTKAQAETICDAITFKNDYAKLSNKAMQRILPKMMNEHLGYSAAIEAVGKDDVNSVYALEGHSKDSRTKSEDAERLLLTAMQAIKRNELRNPIVEKILNQVVILVNQIIKTYGKPDNVAVELARDLHKSAKERQGLTEANSKIEKQKAAIRITIMSNAGAARYFANKDAITDRDILKYRLWNEFEGVSVYEPNDIISLAELFEPNAYEIEHIVPRSLYYDDSFANKTIARRSVNKEKGNTLGMPFMETFKNGVHKDAYIKCINDAFNTGKIGGRKKARLLASEVPTEFANRDLTFTQYIASETLKRLKTVWRNSEILPTVGSITALLRKNWGLDTTIHDDRKADFEASVVAQQKNIVTYHTAAKGNTYERIEGWDKRKDHRHHAIDALVVALTTRSMVQYFNTLNSQESKDVRSLARIKRGTEAKTWDYPSPHPLLRRIADDAMQNVIISYKSGGRIASSSGHRHPNADGKRNTDRTINPRGRLHEETVYGKKLIAQTAPTLLIDLKTELKSEQDFDRILSPHHRAVLYEYWNTDCKRDFKKLYAYYKTNPLVCGKHKRKEIRFADTVYVTRKTVDANFASIEKIIDPNIKNTLEQRLMIHDNNPKKAFVELDKNPIYSNPDCLIPIKKVRITGPKKVRKIPSGYVQEGSNHHLAVYKDEKTGKLGQRVVSFWDAFDCLRATGSPFTANDAEFGTLIQTYQINELVVFDVSREDLLHAVATGNYRPIRKNIYRVQSLANKNYWFRMQYETEIDDSDVAKDMKRFRLIQSLPKLTCIKIEVNVLGIITKVH